ncbi:non-ribosomal peptide synthetase/MFS transporter [Aestuariimicrobium ganziense]|uniref:non-ribosomal peptide synthetase/MFS transporter n=1 Tax=Aestuariimicrobium ganziense TaxID=2773677 RepID=UPI0019429DEF|nr:non-ribosomal peptide synthetase/MFS transporter [Aestuariimicrobium ganziense]
MSTPTSIALSYAQERLWFLEEFQPGTAAYTIPAAFRIRGELDTDRLQRALDTVVARHLPLRTRFGEDGDGRPTAEVVDDVGVDLRVVEASLDEAAEIASREAERGFDLTQVPLIRSVLARVGPDDAVLVLTVHHIAADGWSMDLIARELAAAYDGEPLGDLPTSYADHAASQRAAEDSAALAHWTQQLDGVAPLELPTRPRPAVATSNGEAVQVELDPELVKRLGTFAARQRSTLYMVVLAALEVVLSRFSGQDDFAVGSPVAGRASSDLEQLVGMFANTVVQRADLSGDPSFADLLKRVRRTAISSYAHQDVPFERIVSELGVPRDLSRTPVFTVTFAMQNYLQTVAGNNGLAMERFLHDLRVTRYDLELYLFVDEHGVNGHLMYNTDLFERGLAERLRDALLCVLEAVPDQPDTLVSRLPLLPAAQLTDVLAAGVGPAVEPTDDTLVDLLARQAAATPDAVAVTCDGASLTHAELVERSFHVAQALNSRGVGRDDVVGLCAQRSLAQVVGLVGILRAGAAYLPLDPDLPPARREFLVTDAGAVAVLASAPGLQDGALLVDDLVARAASTSANDSAGSVAVGPRDAVYVIYTSGSTGQPKGVLTEHRAIVNRINWMQRLYRLGAGDAVLHKTPVGFDVSVWELLWPLVSGARLVLAVPGGHRDTAYLRDVIREQQVTTVHFVPSMLSLFLSEEGVDQLSCLRWLFSGGERLAPDLARRAAEVTGAQVHNFYGPAECAIEVCEWPVAKVDPDATTVPLGPPMGGVDVRILDAGLAPVPFGVVGELCIGGIGPARGYLNRPELTAASFVDDPFTPGGRLYRSGDLGRQRPDGVIEFVGRRDAQVKLRGQRLELGEIEAALRTVPGVVAAAADVRGDLLVGYAVPGSGADLEADELRAGVALQLPETMVPGAFVVLDELPLGPTGKLDRARLPEPEVVRVQAAERIPPSTPVEKAIASAWQQVLEVDEVVLDDDFFHLGGHSLVAIQVVAKLRSTLPEGARGLSVMDLFRLRTVRRMAEFAVSDEVGEQHLLHELTAEVARPLLTVVCVPHGGGSAVIYQGMADELPRDVALYALAIPGHDVGVTEEALPFKELAARVCDEVVERIEGPVVLYGHCGVGSAVIVELALLLQQAGRAADAVYIGASFPFARPTGLFGRLVGLVSSERLTGDRSYENWMRALGADLSDLDPEQARFIIHNVRKDSQTAERYFTDLFETQLGRLEAPVVSVVGEHDPATDYATERYREYHRLSPVTALVELPAAGHYFVKYRPGDLAEIVTQVHPALARGGSDVGSSSWTLSQVSREDEAPVLAGIEAADARPGLSAGPVRKAAVGGQPGEGRGTARPSMGRFAIIAGSQLVSNLGSALTDFALPLWVFLQTQSVTQYAILFTLAMVPGLLVAPLAGAIVDRHRRKVVMLVSDTVAGVLEAGLAVLYFTGNLSVWHVYLLVASMSMALTFHRLAYQSAIPQLVPKRYLGHANGLSQMFGGMAQLAVPLVAAGVMAAAGLGGIITIDISTFLFAFVILVLVRFPMTMPFSRKETLLHEMKLGFQHATRTSGFRAMLAWFALLNIFLSPMVLLLSPLVLGFSDLRGVGIVSAAGGAGAFVGGLVLGIWGGPRERKMRGVLVSAVAIACFAFLAGTTPRVSVVALAFAGLYFSLSVMNGIYATIVQTKVAPRFHGRVFAVQTLAAWSTLPLAFLVVAPGLAAWFEPLMLPGGVLADSVGRVIGVGPGRGVGLLYLVLSVVIAVLSLVSLANPRLANLDVEMPDAVPDDVIGLAELEAAHGGPTSPVSPDGTSTAAAARSRATV